MPLYRYKCAACAVEFSEILPSEEADKPTEAPCPSCRELRVERVFSFNYNAKKGYVETSAPDSDFKSVMNGIKKGSPGNNMPDF